MDILALSNLLKESQQCSDNKDELNEKQVPSSNHHSIITPASFGPPISNTTDPANYLPDPKQKTDDSGAIWSSEEVSSATSALVESPNDDRGEPPYQIYFKQEVGTEDIFLGSEKTPGSFDCTHVVVKVYFPNTNKDELNLDVKAQSFFVESSSK